MTRFFVKTEWSGAYFPAIGCRGLAGGMVEQSPEIVGIGETGGGDAAVTGETRAVTSAATTLNSYPVNLVNPVKSIWLAGFPL